MSCKTKLKPFEGGGGGAANGKQIMKHKEETTEISGVNNPANRMKSYFPSTEKHRRSLTLIPVIRPIM